MKKNSLLLALLFLCVSTCKPMDNDASPCKKIEQISPDATPVKYVKLVALLRNKGLSVCDCVKQLSEDRINAQKPALEKEWQISEQNWKNIEAITQQIAEQDNQPGTTIVNVARDTFPKEYLPYFTEENIKNIENKFKQAGCTNNTITITYEPSTIAVMVRSMSHREHQHPIDRVNKKLSKFIYGDNYILKLGPPFFDGYSQEGRQGILLHEIYGHAAHNDSVKIVLLFMSACIYKPELFEPSTQEKAVQQFLNSPSMLDITRALEARADQVPACTTITNARLAEKVPIESKNMYGNLNHTPRYDSTNDRLVMATRIRKLKEAEEYLGFNTQQKPQEQKSFIYNFYKYLKREMA